MRTLPLLVAVALLGAACGGDGTGDAERFCGEVQAHTTELVTAPASADEIDGFVERYRRIGELAPLAIEPHWQALVLNYETASTVEPGDPESVQRAVGRAYATERSAVAVQDWLLTNCNVDIGPVATIVPAAPPPPPTSAPPG